MVADFAMANSSALSTLFSSEYWFTNAAAITMIIAARPSWPGRYVAKVFGCIAATYVSNAIIRVVAKVQILDGTFKLFR